MNLQPNAKIYLQVLDQNVAMLYGERLKIAIEHRSSVLGVKISKSELARAAGCSPQNISMILSHARGDDQKLSLEKHAKAAAFLKVDAHWLATGDGEMIGYLQQAKEFEDYLDNDPRAKITHQAIPINLARRGMVVAQESAKLIALDNNPEYPSIRRVNIKAQAGVSGYAVEHMGDDGPPIVFRADWYKSKGYRPDKMLALRVTGESMIPSLYEGDLIVINTEQTQPKQGLPFLVSYEGEVVVKRMVRDDGLWWLTSDNPDQRRYPRTKCNGETQIIGEVVYRQTERI